MNYKARIEKTKYKMQEWGVDILVINPSPEWFWLTGSQVFDDHTIYRVPGDWITSIIISLEHDPFILLYETDAEQIEQTSAIKDIRQCPLWKDGVDYFEKQFSSISPDHKTIACSRSAWAETIINIQKIAPHAKLVTATCEMVDQLHVIKEPEEIEAMQTVADLTDQAFEKIVAQLKPGISLRDVYLECEYQLKKAGAQALSFSPAAVAIPKGGTIQDWRDHPFEITVESGMALGFDLGARFNGYCSDFGRTVFIGEPTSQALAGYQALVNAVTSLVEKLGDQNMTTLDCIAHVQNSIAEEGFAQFHTMPDLGHSIGIVTHENPWLFTHVDQIIQKNMCLALEPKIHIPGQVYMRLEDNILVGEDRSYFLTNFKREPVII